MGLIRILTTVRQTLTHVFYADEQPVDAGVVTVTTKRLDGTTTDAATAGGNFQAGYTYSFPPSANPDVFTVDWSGSIAGAAVTTRDIVEVVGGFFFTLVQARDSHPSLRDTAKYPTATLAAKRIQVEQECERIRRQAQVPRYARVALDGNGSNELIAPDFEIRRIRAVSFAVATGGPFTAMDTGALASVVGQSSGVIVNTAGIWPVGYRNVIVEYEYGLDMPDQSIVDASLSRLRYVLAASRSGIPDRALSWTTNEGGTYRLTTAGPSSTGDPDIDAAYLRDANARVWIA